MPWAVCDKSDLICIMSARLGFDPIQSRAECLHEIGIGFLIASAYVVRFARTTAREHGAQSCAMVADIEPVSIVQAIAVDGQRFSSQRAGQHQRDHFFWKLIRAVVV